MDTLFFRQPRLVILALFVGATRLGFGGRRHAHRAHGERRGDGGGEKLLHETSPDEAEGFRLVLTLEPGG